VIQLSRSPPVAGLALFVGLGAILPHQSVPLSWTLPPCLILLLLNRLSQRPNLLWEALILALVSGAMLSQTRLRADSADCRFLLREGQTLSFSGQMVGQLVEGRGEFLPSRADRGTCAKILRLVIPGAEGGKWGAGSLVTVRGVWRKSGVPGFVPAQRAGYLRVDSISGTGPSPGRTALPQERLVALGGWVQNRLGVLFPRMEPLAIALVWARKEGLSQEIRESFARAGVAHLLAISGFHVGVVAGVFLLLLGLLGFPHSLRFALASVGVWGYTLAIGVPDAAFRAAILLSVFAVARAGGRSVTPMGALSTAFLGFLVLEPGALLRPGFQLSYAGALGLVVGYRPLSEWISRFTGGRLPRHLPGGLAAGIAATLATLPLVAWHFGRVSLIGIPVTLLVTPLVALAIPGIFLCLILSLLHPGLAGFLASGVEWILLAQLQVVRGAAALPFSSAWVSHPTVLAGTGAFGVVGLFFALGGNAGRWRRMGVFGFAVAVGVVLGPPVARLQARGTLELVVLDVGQGDAALLRSPGGRWVLVDAGPRTRTFDAGVRAVLPYLRRRGVRSLEYLILTHPDMDHVGGAASILRQFPVETVLGPGIPAGTEVFLDALMAAHEEGVPWQVVTAGDSLNLDGMALRVLAPGGPQKGEGGRGEGPEGPNGASVVLEVRFGAFSALLTGDAPAASEARLLPGILSASTQVLKVGHHGSRTSTSDEFLKRISPETALISVGRRNQFGHPDPEVLSRLRKEGTAILRTDLNGILTIRARPDGSYVFSSEHR